MEKKSAAKGGKPRHRYSPESRKRSDENKPDDTSVLEEELIAIEGFLLPQVLEILQRK